MQRTSGRDGCGRTPYLDGKARGAAHLTLPAHRTNMSAPHNAQRAYPQQPRWREVTLWYFPTKYMAVKVTVDGRIFYDLYVLSLNVECTVLRPACVSGCMVADDKTADTVTDCRLKSDLPDL